MAVLSIKIRIGDRDYPMKVDESEEELVRNAGQYINQKLKQFKKEYGVHDKQDLLAMIALDNLIQLYKADNSRNEEEEEIHKKVSYLNSLISKTLSG